MERPVLTEEEMANELDRVASICTTTRLAAAARYGAELIRKCKCNRPEECRNHIDDGKGKERNLSTELD